MKTWILCVDQLGAKLYWRANSKDPVHFWTQIPYPSFPSRKRKPSSSEEAYAQYIAEVTEVACNNMSHSSLVICAEPKVLARVSQELSPELRSRVIGVVDCNLCHVSDERLNERSQNFLEQAEVQ